jgi:hypothetical protein
MGAVGPEVVAATFYNFNPEVVARVIPRAWTLATPEQVLDARLDGVDQALTRLLGDHVKSDEVAEAAELAREASKGCTGEGRPLYAAHAGLAWPGEPHLVLWHALTLVREYRGDGHIAALVLNGLSGLEALITHVATGRGFATDAAKLTRGWSEEQWTAAAARLAGRGLLDAEGALTEAGAAVRDSVEAAPSPPPGGRGSTSGPSGRPGSRSCAAASAAAWWKPAPSRTASSPSGDPDQSSKITLCSEIVVKYCAPSDGQRERPRSTCPWTGRGSSRNGLTGHGRSCHVTLFQAAQRPQCQYPQ